MRVRRAQSGGEVHEPVAAFLLAMRVLQPISRVSEHKALAAILFAWDEETGPPFHE